MRFRFRIAERDNMRIVDVFVAPEGTDFYEPVGHLIMTRKDVRSLMELVKPKSDDGDTAEFLGPESVHHKAYHGKA